MNSSRSSSRSRGRRSNLHKSSSSASSTIAEMATANMEQQVRDFIQELGGSSKLSPDELGLWIVAKIDANVDSVYLVPVGGEDANMGSKFYVYTLVTSEEAMKAKQFLTLR